MAEKSGMQKENEMVYIAAFDFALIALAVAGFAVCGWYWTALRNDRVRHGTYCRFEVLVTRDETATTLAKRCG